MLLIFVILYLFVGSFYLVKCSDVPIINIQNGCCLSEGKDKSCDKDHETLMFNLTKLLHEHEMRLKVTAGSIDLSSGPLDCQDIQRLGYTETGVYTIYPEGTVGFPVRCDMDTSDGGWTVVQRRVSDSDFYRTWTEYQIGFGNLRENFWLGNQQIHTITSQGWYELRVDLLSQDGESAYAEYNVFSVGDLGSMYKLTIDGYSGNAGDSLSSHNGMKFTTKDKDNDIHGGNCAQIYDGAWWYGKCHASNLNGVYGAIENKGPRWYTFKETDPMKETEMKIRRWKPTITY